MFYHDIKEHMSPSSMEQWNRQRSSFVSTYFDKKDKVETAAMRGGKQIHRLIEGGMIKVKNHYELNEEPIKVQVPGTDFYFLGIPDSRKKDGTKFVDYKSGKANNWKDKLATDIKMKSTAWLIWQEKKEEPKEIKAAVEFIQTTWDEITKEIVPVEEESTDVIEIIYTAKELKEFTKVIIKSMEEVNEFYEKWQNKTDEFISKADIEKYEKLDEKKRKLEDMMKDIKERIQGQMEMGGLTSHKTDNGTFSTREYKKYDYPETLPIKVGKKKYTLKEVEKIESTAKATKKNYELNTDPISSSVTLSYRAKK